MPASNGIHMAQADVVVIYEPPIAGLPYPVVTITQTGVHAVPVASRTEARVMVSLRKKRERDD
jgi:hypothetical protein